MVWSPVTTYFTGAQADFDINGEVRQLYEVKKQVASATYYMLTVLRDRNAEVKNLIHWWFAWSAMPILKKLY